MNQQEFHERIGGTVDGDEWEVVQFVYQWHPAIPDQDGKNTAANLWRIGGIELFREMRHIAERAHQAETILKEAEEAVGIARKRVEELHAPYRLARNRAAAREGPKDA